MKFTYNSTLKIALSGLKVSALAVAMVAIVACGSKKDDKKKSDNPSSGGTAIMVSNDGGFNHQSEDEKVEITSCVIDGVTLPLHSLTEKEDWTGTINVATSKFVSGAMVCKDTNNVEYHAWYHYREEDGICADADLVKYSNGDDECKKGATMYHHFFDIDGSSAKWGQDMTQDMRVSIWSAKDVTDVTCTVAGNPIALTDVREEDEGYNAELVVPAGTFKYGEKVDLTCSNGKGIHVYANTYVEDSVKWE